MTLKALGLTALSAALAVGFAGSAGAASTKHERASVHAKKHTSSMHNMHRKRHMSLHRGRDVTVTSSTGIGRYIVSPGDSPALIDRAYPNDANPPSLTQTYNLRGRKMNENRK